MCNKVFETATVVKKQICSADLIIVNKCDQVNKIQIQETKDIITTVKSDLTIKETSFGNFKRGWIKNIRVNVDDKGSNTIQVTDISLKKYLIKVDENMDLIEFEKFIKMFSRLLQNSGNI